MQSFGKLSEGVWIDNLGFQKLQTLLLNKKNRIILYPVYKSYADPLILHYIHFLKDIELGFTFGNYEDSPKIPFVDNILKKIGTILIRRDPKTSTSRHTMKLMDPNLMNYVNSSIFQDVVESNVITTIFQNDARIRTGKFTIP